MEICPECGSRSLCYNPRLKRAECLQMDCSYSRTMSCEEYSRLFEIDKNVAHKLSLK